MTLKNSNGHVFCDDECRGVFDDPADVGWAETPEDQEREKCVHAELRHEDPPDECCSCGADLDGTDYDDLG